jgi:hypothetical protein
LRLTIELELDVTGDWEVVSVAKLDAIEHGPAPQGNFCAHAGIDLCTPKASFAGEVHKNIERYLSPRVMKELGKAEGELQKQLDLRGRASALWAAVQKPLRLQKAGDKACATVLLASCKKDAWLTFEPTSFGLSELSVVDGDFGVDVGLEGKLTVATHKKPKAGTAKLPKPTKIPGSTSLQVSAIFEVPTAVFEQTIERELSSLELGQGKDRLELSDISVSAIKGDLRVQVETKGPDKSTFYLTATPVFDQKKGEIRVERVAFEEQTKKLFEQQGIDADRIAEAVRKAIYVPVGKEARVLRRGITSALGQALPGQLDVKGLLDEVDFQSVDVEGGNVVRLKAELRGSLTLELSF